MSAMSKYYSTIRNNIKYLHRFFLLNFRFFRSVELLSVISAQFPLMALSTCVNRVIYNKYKSQEHKAHQESFLLLQLGFVLGLLGIIGYDQLLSRNGHL